MQIVPQMKLYGIYLDFIVFLSWLFCLKFGGPVWVIFLYFE